MIRILRENPLLAVSIALPILVVVLFAGATAIPRFFVDPPSHDLLLTVESGDQSRMIPVRIALGVEDGRVIARVVKLGEHQQAYAPRLFRYQHGNGSVSEVHVPMPAFPDTLADGQVMAIPELADVSVSSDLRAPDGYEYRGRSHHRGLMVELFGSSRGDRKITVAKNGAIVSIHLPETDYWYYGVNFLGWVVEGDG